MIESDGGLVWYRNEIAANCLELVLMDNQVILYCKTIWQVSE